MSDHPELTVMIFIRQGDTVLLSRRLNTWFGENQFAPPGGLVDDGESPSQAAVREVAEETGLTLQPKHLTLLESNTTTDNGRELENYYYSVCEFSGIPKNREPDRHSELDWYPIKKLPPDTMPMVRAIVERHLLL